jgi:hypothetical protein
VHGLKGAADLNHDNQHPVMKGDLEGMLLPLSGVPSP